YALVGIEAVPEDVIWRSYTSGGRPGVAPPAADSPSRRRMSEKVIARDVHRPYDGRWGLGRGSPFLRDPTGRWPARARRCEVGAGGREGLKRCAGGWDRSSSTSAWPTRAAGRPTPSDPPASPCCSRRSRRSPCPT